MTRLNPFQVHQQAVLSLLILSTLIGCLAGLIGVVVSEYRGREVRS